MLFWISFLKNLQVLRSGINRFTKFKIISQEGKVYKINYLVNSIISKIFQDYKENRIGFYKYWKSLFNKRYSF